MYSVSRYYDITIFADPLSREKGTRLCRGRKKTAVRRFSGLMSCADGAKEARSRASLDSRRPEEVSSGLLAYVGLALKRSDRQRFSRGRLFGSYKVGCKFVQSAYSVKTAVYVSFNLRRLARINFPYGRYIRFVRILSPSGELYPGCPEGLPLVRVIHKRPRMETRSVSWPLMRRHAQWHYSRKTTAGSFSSFQSKRTVWYSTFHKE